MELRGSGEEFESFEKRYRKKYTYLETGTLTRFFKKYAIHIVFSNKIMLLVLRKNKRLACEMYSGKPQICLFQTVT